LSKPQSLYARGTGVYSFASGEPDCSCRDFLDQVRERGDYADDVTPEELAASEAAYQDYLAGRPGLSSKELKAELFGKKACSAWDYIVQKPAVRYLETAAIERPGAGI